MGESKPEPKPDKKRVTLRDVAEEAGVSLKTASNVINHSGRMTDSTREKVQEVIDRLGYRVNVSARNLNRGKTGFITLAVPTLTAPYLSELANRVIDAARGFGSRPPPPRIPRPPRLRLLRIRHHLRRRIRTRSAITPAQLQHHRLGRHDPVDLRSRKP